MDQVLRIRRRKSDGIEGASHVVIWLSWFVFPSGLENGITSIVFLMVIVLAKGERLALETIYFGRYTPG